MSNQAHGGYTFQGFLGLCLAVGQMALIQPAMADATPVRALTLPLCSGQKFEALPDSLQGSYTDSANAVQIDVSVGGITHVNDGQTDVTLTADAPKNGQSCAEIHHVNNNDKNGDTLTFKINAHDDIDWGTEWSSQTVALRVHADKTALYQVSDSRFDLYLFFIPYFQTDDTDWTSIQKAQ